MNKELKESIKSNIDKGVYCYTSEVDKEELKSLGFIIDDSECKDFKGCILWDKSKHNIIEGF